MSSQKKNSDAWPKRVYTTKRLRQNAQAEKLKEDLPRIIEKVKTFSPVPVFVLDPVPIPDPVPLPLPVSVSPPISSIKEENIVTPKNKNLFKASIIMGSLSLMALWITSIVSFRFSQSWSDSIVSKLNVLTVGAGAFILNLIQGACKAQGTVLSTHYYRISMQGDKIPFYSLIALVIVAALIILFKRTSWQKRALVFISLVPLVLMANILRVIVAFGLALNEGPVYADHCFHGILAGGVLIFIVLGAIFIDFLFFPE